MFHQIKSEIGRDSDYPARQFEIDVLTRVLDGELYDHIPYPFAQEYVEGIGEYISLRKRKPAVRYNLCRIVVDDSVSLLFGDQHFPSLDCKDDGTRQSLEQVIKESQLQNLMIEAATTGSVGSVAIFMRVLSNRLFFESKNTQYLTPKWKAAEPDTLESVTEQYKVKGDALRDSGYAISDDDLVETFWFRRVWDKSAETWYVPKKLKDATTTWTVDGDNTITHRLGFVPVVWIKNLPSRDKIDGACTFPEEAIDDQIEIDYQLSQVGRGLKYSSDPTLLLKEPREEDGQVVKGAGNAIVVEENGDGKLLEIDGDAARAVIEYVRALREMALESAHGNRISPDKLSAAHSGRAMEMMNQDLIRVAAKLRISYGEGGLLKLLDMVVQASQTYELRSYGKPLGRLSLQSSISLRWPHWHAPTYADKQIEANALSALRKAGLISQETAIKAIASSYDILDPAEELAKIGRERQYRVA